jgi:hypothetical protein
MVASAGLAPDVLVSAGLALDGLASAGLAPDVLAPAELASAVLVAAESLLGDGCLDWRLVRCAGRGTGASVVAAVYALSLPDTAAAASEIAAGGAMESAVL